MAELNVCVCKSYHAIRACCVEKSYDKKTWPCGSVRRHGDGGLASTSATNFLYDFVHAA